MMVLPTPYPHFREVNAKQNKSVINLDFMNYSISNKKYFLLLGHRTFFSYLVIQIQIFTMVSK